MMSVLIEPSKRFSNVVRTLLASSSSAVSEVSPVLSLVFFIPCCWQNPGTLLIVGLLHPTIAHSILGPGSRSGPRFLLGLLYDLCEQSPVDDLVFVDVELLRLDDVSSLSFLGRGGRCDPSGVVVEFRVVCRGDATLFACLVSLFFPLKVALLGPCLFFR